MMKKKYILALTFLLMLFGQASYGQGDLNESGGNNDDYYDFDAFWAIAGQSPDNSYWVFDDYGNAFADVNSSVFAGDVVTSTMNYLDYGINGTGEDTAQIVQMMQDLTEEQMDIWATLNTVAVNSYTNFDHDRFITDVTKSYLDTQVSLGLLNTSTNTSSLAEQTISLLPVVGPLYQSGQALNNGEYLAASAYFLWAGLDLYTLGAFSEASLLIKASAVLAEEVVLRNLVTREVTIMSLPSTVISTFENGLYKTVVTEQPLLAYRSFGNLAYLEGSYATRTANASRAELAILDEWNNSMRFEATINIPIDQTLNVGKAARQISQDGFQTLVGQGDQILLPQNWDYQNWVTKIIDKTTGIEYTFNEFLSIFPNTIK